MKFDHTFIAIRQRTTLEIYDLALHVIRDYFAPLAILLFVGALPWLILDWCLLGWMLNDEHCDSYAVSLWGMMINGGEYDRYAVSYGWLILMLIINQAHAGTAMISHYLGQSMFIGKPSVMKSIKMLWQVPITYYWLHYGLRFVIPVAFFAWMASIYHDHPDNFALNVVMMVFCTFMGLVIRGFRPYVTKVIVLEKAPWKPTSANPVSFAKRSVALHGSGGSSLFSRFLMAIVVGPLLALAVYGLLALIHSSLTILWSEGFVELALIWPISLWIVAGFFAIVRFLTYIDLRIRQEGWEVELRIRAEALKLEQAAQ